MGVEKIDVEAQKRKFFWRDLNFMYGKVVMPFLMGALILWGAVESPTESLRLGMNLVATLWWFLAVWGYHDLHGEWAESARIITEAESLNAHIDDMERQRESLVELRERPMWVQQPTEWVN